MAGYLGTLGNLVAWRFDNSTTSHLPGLRYHDRWMMVEPGMKRDEYPEFRLFVPDLYLRIWINGETSAHLGWSAKSKELEQLEPMEHNSAHISRLFRPSHH